MNIPLNYYHADDFPEIATEQEGFEDDFVNARLEEISELYTSEYPNIGALEAIVHRLFRREFPIHKHPRLGYANSGEAVRAFALKRYEKLKKFVRFMDLERDMDKYELFDFCNRIERQLLSGQYDAKRIEFFEKPDGGFWWDLHPTEKKNKADSRNSRPLSPFFQSVEKLDLALRAAFETGLINEAGKWAYLGDKTNAVTMFWRAAVTTGLANPDAPVYKVSKAMESQFSIRFGQNSIISPKQKKGIADFGEDYKELYKALCDAMRP